VIFLRYSNFVVFKFKWAEVALRLVIHHNLLRDASGANFDLFRREKHNLVAGDICGINPNSFANIEFNLVVDGFFNNINVEYGVLQLTVDLVQILLQKFKAFVG